MPGNTIGKGVVEVTYDKGQAEKSARDAILPGLSRVAGDMAGVFAGKKIFDFAKQGFAELGEAEKVAALTTSTIKATGAAAGVTAEDVSGLAGRLSELSGKDDELIQSGSNLILTFKNIKNAAGEGNDIFDQATEAALNLSTAGFGSMESASVMLGKALNDPIAGITALGRAGVTFSDDQKAAIKSLADTGDLLGAQKIILGEVEAQVGGAAAAYGQTLPGQLERAQNSMDEAKAAMVSGLAPALEIGANLAVTASQKFAELPEGLQQIVGATALVGGGIGALARPVGDAIRLLQLMRGETIALAAAETASATATNSAASVSGLYQKSVTDMTTSTKVFAGVAGVATVAALYAFGQSLNKTKLDAEDLAKITKSSGDELIGVFDDIIASAKGPFAHIFDDALKDLVEKGPEGIGVLTQLRDHYKQIGDSEHLGQVEAALNEAAEGQKNLNTNVELGTDEINDATDATDDYADAVKTLDDEMRDLTDTVLGSFGAALQLSDAQIAGRSAIDEYTKATKDHSLSLDELKSKENAAFEAILAQSEASRDNAQAQYEAAGGVGVSVDANKALIEELYGVATTLDPASPLKQQLLDYIAKLQAVPGDVPTTATFVSAEATQAIINFQRALNGIPLGVDVQVDLRQGRGGQTFAAEGFSGWVDSPTSFVVAEGGQPEFVSVIPKSEMGGFDNFVQHPSNGAWGGLTINVPIQVAGYTRDKRAMDELGEAVADKIWTTLYSKAETVKELWPAGSSG